MASSRRGRTPRDLKTDPRLHSDHPKTPLRIDPSFEAHTYNKSTYRRDVGALSGNRGARSCDGNREESSTFLFRVGSVPRLVETSSPPLELEVKMGSCEALPSSPFGLQNHSQISSKVPLNSPTELLLGRVFDSPQIEGFSS